MKKVMIVIFSLFLVYGCGGLTSSIKTKKELPPAVAIKNDTIIDKETGLMWQLEKAEDDMYLDRARDYCKELQQAGFDDWRLPNISELRSTYKLRKSLKRLNFLQYYWSSTIDDHGALVFNYMHYRENKYYHADMENEVRCVRNTEEKIAKEEKRKNVFDLIDAYANLTGLQKRKWREENGNTLIKGKGTVETVRDLKYRKGGYCFNVNVSSNEKSKNKRMITDSAYNFSNLQYPCDMEEFVLKLKSEDKIEFKGQLIGIGENTATIKIK